MTARARAIVTAQCTSGEVEEVEAAGWDAVSQAAGSGIGLYAITRRDATPTGTPGTPWGHVPGAGAAMLAEARRLAAAAADAARVGPSPSGMPCRVCGGVESRAPHRPTEIRERPEIQLRGQPAAAPYDPLDRYRPVDCWTTDHRYGTPVCGACATVINAALRVWSMTGQHQYATAGEAVADYLAADAWQLGTPPPPGCELAAVSCWTTAAQMSEYGTDWPWPGRWAYIPAGWRAAVRDLIPHLGAGTQTPTGVRMTEAEIGRSLVVDGPDGVVALPYAITTRSPAPDRTAARIEVARRYVAWRDGHDRPTPTTTQDYAHA
ncbi:hypothetical protein AB0G95_21775 [Streptomyces virginiae]|uniref:hypothetical protein n=1 Tax=Streptomyces virginiae TaxID=1961 RepID=UPI003449DC6D